MSRWTDLIDELRAEFLKRELSLVQRERQLDILRGIDSALLSGLSLEKTFGGVADSVGEMLGAGSVRIMLRAGASNYTVASTEEASKFVSRPMDGTLVGKIAESGQAVVLGDLSQLKDVSYSRPVVEGSAEPLSVAVVPIADKSRILGVIAADSTKLDAFSTAHLDLLGPIADQCALAIQSARLIDEQEVQRSVDRLLKSEPDDRAVRTELARILDSLKSNRLLDIQAAQILLSRHDHLVIAASTDPSHLGSRISLDHSVSGRAWLKNAPENIDDVAVDPDYQRLLGDDVVSELAVPITVAGEPIGVLNIESPRQAHFRGFYEETFVRLADRLAGILAYAKLRQDAIDAMEQKAANDVLVAVGDQASNMLHTLNNSIAAAGYWLGEIRDAQDKDELQGVLGQALPEIEAALQEATSLPNQLKERLAFEGEIPVDTTVEQVVASFKTQASAQGIEIVCETNASGLRIQGLQLENVVDNLVSNALTAMAGLDHAGTIWVMTSEIKAKGLPSNIEVVVEDDGPGIPDSRLEAIMNPGVSFSKGSGMGFGLWWIRTFLTRVDGTLDVGRRSGGGTRVVVRVPSTGQKEVK